MTTSEWAFLLPLRTMKLYGWNCSPMVVISYHRGEVSLQPWSLVSRNLYHLPPSPSSVVSSTARLSGPLSQGSNSLPRHIKTERHMPGEPWDLKEGHNSGHYWLDLRLPQTSVKGALGGGRSRRKEHRGPGRDGVGATNL